LYVGSKFEWRGSQAITVNLLNFQAQLPNAADENRPLSFIGYKFKIIQRISFYSVAEKDFARYEVYKFNPITQCWIYSLRVP
jgi:hypothetical protein